MAAETDTTGAPLGGRSGEYGAPAAPAAILSCMHMCYSLESGGAIWRAMASSHASSMLPGDAPRHRSTDSVNQHRTATPAACS